MLADQSPPAWAQFVDTMDIERNYYVTFAAVITTILSLCLPWFAVSFIITPLANAVLEPSDASFMIDNYMPDLNQATKDISVSHDDKKLIANQFIGILMKMLWSFVFQEHVMSFMSFLYGPVGLTLTNSELPDFNDLAVKISGFP